MRVLVDAAVLRRPHTGTARWVEGLVSALEERPVSIRTALGPQRIRGGRLFRPVNVARQRWWYDFGIRRAAGSWAADVLLMPAGFAARRGRIPQLVTILDVNFLTSPGTYEPAFVRYATWALRRAARDADALTTISSFSRDEISKHLGVDPSRITVVYPGISDPPSGEFERLLDRPYALFVGSTEPHKNISVLLDAWERLPSELTLVVVGQPGRDHANLAARAAGLGDRVVLAGRASESQLESWYRHANVFMFPSLTEGFGLPPLEAMRRGVPVVSSTGGSLPEVLGDAASYHDPRDSDALISAVEALLGDDLLRAARIKAGLERSAQFTWQRAGLETEGLLRDLVDRV